MWKPRPDQCGALCWRLDAHGTVQVLLVTSKITGRWIIPKGNIKKHEKLHECARREAFEEAGVSGRIGKCAIGRYEYLKLEKDRTLTVSVFQMLVEESPQTIRREMSDIEAGSQLPWLLIRSPKAV